MVYITGDTHGETRRLRHFYLSESLSPQDCVIILGDAGYNFYGGEKDWWAKKKLEKFEATFFCIHGNHEIRPANIPAYHEKTWNGGTVYSEDEFPNLLFAKDGEIYDIAGKRCIAIGGAYSIDKYIRLQHGYGWWPDEQPSAEIRAYVESQLAARGNQVDVVLSHTCPLKYLPYEAFLSMVDQSTVDNSTEIWLDAIEDRIDYDQWYCGHYHTEKRIDRMEFLFESIIPFCP